MASSRIQTLVWWRRWGKEMAVATTALFIILFGLTFNFDPSPKSGGTIRASDDVVELTLVRSAKDRGAVCLDGSSPGYYFQKGFGSGLNNWLLHIEGGGWCNSVASCSARKTTALGSSTYMDHQIFFSGILSSDESQNPDFFNWNKVKIRYCDGASLSGLVATELENGTFPFFSGQLIWEAIMDELLSAGLTNARQALLSGCSAGGLATLIHCDNFRELLPNGSNVKCLADAAFFLDEEDVSGKHRMRSFYHDVVTLQGVARNLHKGCTSRMEPSQCFFPQQVIKNIKTPVFLVNPAYDFWQIQNILVPDASDPRHEWLRCKLNIHNCNPDQIERLQEFRTAMLSALSEFQQRKDGGLFMNSCFVHCQTWMSNTWHAPNSPRIDNKTIAEAVGDWYFDRREVKEVDCPYPCNPTCYNMVFSYKLHKSWSYSLFLTSCCSLLQNPQCHFSFQQTSGAGD